MAIVPPEHVDHLQCTAEHLQDRQHGGADTARNVVAACAWCNRRRHEGRTQSAPSPKRYRNEVLLAMAAGTWHPAAHALTQMHAALTAPPKRVVVQKTLA
ncbi:HNH endonuclease [Acidovorax sp. CF316]|uniref:HNH endonuclease n=1 Tax=Acidovorax sp. CF316 TaxID=1144317 RepID=UPI00350ED1BF